MYADLSSGADGAVHMCEEIKDASTVVPRSLIISIGLNGVLGFGMLLAVLFCLGNIDDALASPTKFPFIEIFAQAAGSGGATAMVTLILFLIIFACIAVFAAASRMMWAFARDKGLPGSGILSRVSLPSRMIDLLHTADFLPRSSLAPSFPSFPSA